MPYWKPELAFIDFRHFQASQLSTTTRYPATDPIPELQLTWEAGEVKELEGKSILVRCGLTASMVWNDKGGTTRFVITIEHRRDHRPHPEQEIARGDASAAAGQRQSFSLASFYGPIVWPGASETIILRARWATVSGRTSTIEKGDSGMNELWACAYTVG